MFLMLLGLWVHLGDSNAALKITLAIFFQLVTIPVASHLVGLLALQKNLPRWKERPLDDHRKPEE
jgi:multicomponent Na+:H+ antiporter subunit G